MKKNILIPLLGLILSTGLIPRLGQITAQAQPGVSFQVFYDQLSPYGTWVNYPDYGYVWVPAGGSDFRPYGTRGHWVYADEGWTWVSGYSWGWAPFHYGNWFYDDSYGWMWAPGFEWAPAWVTWGEYGGNYCWAPVGPRVDIGISFNSYRPAPNYWTFCPRDRITSVNVSNYYVQHVHNTTVINNITVINNVNRGGGGRAYLRGPAPDNVAKYTHTPIRPVAIRTADRPGVAHVQHGQLAIYRPAVQSSGNASARPARVQDLHALRPLPGAHPAPGNNRPGGAPATQKPGSTGGRTPQPAPHQPANNPAPVHSVPPRHVSPAARPSINPGDRPITPQGRPAPHQPAPNNNRPPVLQHNTPSPHPAPQPQHPAAQPHPAPQLHPAVQPRPMPQPRPTPMPQQPHPVQQQPAPRPHPLPQAPHPLPQAPHPSPAPRPAPAPPHQNPPEPEHH